jgi:hypothetical protein
LRREHGQHIDMVKFARDVDYARLVLRSVSDTGNHDIVTAATQLLIEIDKSRAQTLRTAESAQVGSLSPTALRGGAIAAPGDDGGSAATPSGRRSSFFGMRQSMPAQQSQPAGPASVSSQSVPGPSSLLGTPSQPSTFPPAKGGPITAPGSAGPLTSPGSQAPTNPNAPQPPKKRYISGLR